MRWPLAVILFALALSRLVGASRADPPVSVSPCAVSVRDAFLGPALLNPPQLEPVDPARRERKRPETTSEDSASQEANRASSCHWPANLQVDSQRPVLGFFFRQGPPYLPNCHPTAFGLVSYSSNPVGEADNEKPAKPKGPTTFPEALSKYFHCVHSHLQGFSEADTSAGEKDKKNGDDKNGNGEEKDGNGKKDDEPAPTWYSAHAQATFVAQSHNQFPAPYTGPNSLSPQAASANSITSTLFFAARLCEGTDLVINPEVAGGTGFDTATGLANFPNGEITRVGVVEPTPYFARFYLRQTIGFGGEEEKVQDGPNQIAGSRAVNRLTIAVGKMTATDVVDDNRYSHDPRTQFLPWGIMYNGAWDYPANVRGYTYGVALDFNQKNWALRYGIFAEPTVANGAALDPKFLKANGQALEWLGRYTVNKNPGNLRLMFYLNRAHMGDYAESLALMPVNPNVADTRSYRYKYGFGMSWDQELTKELGMFARLGWNDGRTEAWAFTAMDRLAEVGWLLKGKCWCRPNDFLGLACAIAGLAKDHRNYLAAGGLDFNIGDGKLNYGTEDVVEAFYIWQINRGIFLTVDFQEFFNLAYNRDRGPVSVLTGRFHIEF